MWIAITALKLLEALAQQEPLELFSRSDAQLQSLGERAMQIGDMYFERVIEQNISYKDEETQRRYQVLVEMLKDK